MTVQAAVYGRRRQFVYFLVMRTVRLYKLRCMVEGDNLCMFSDEYCKAEQAAVYGKRRQFVYFLVMSTVRP